MHPAVNATAGTSDTANIARQFEVDLNVTFTMYPRSIPNVRHSWNNPMARPRMPLGTHSVMYSGTTIVMIPIAIPWTSLPKRAIRKSFAARIISIPTINISPETVIDLRRPIRSAMGPLTSVIMAPPPSTAATRSDICVALMPISTRMNGSAPETTPMSKPYRTPPILANASMLMVVVVSFVFMAHDSRCVV